MNNLLKTITCLIVLWIPQTARAQDDLNQIQLSYLRSKAKFMNNIFLSDTGYAKAILADEAFVIRNLPTDDTDATKDFLSGSKDFYAYFNSNIADKSNDDPDRIRAIADYQNYIAFYKLAQANPGIESCSGCYFLRTIRVTVQERRPDQTLRLLPCKSVSYRKIISVTAPATSHQITSYTCPDYVRTVSIGPHYEFIVEIPGRNPIKFEREVRVGTSKSDVQDITLIVEP